MKACLIFVLSVFINVGNVLAQAEPLNLNYNFGTSTTSSCRIVNGVLYVNGQPVRPLNADDLISLNDYNNKVHQWKMNLRNTILQALPFRVRPGQPIGLEEWPFGPLRNPFMSGYEQERQEEIALAQPPPPQDQSASQEQPPSSQEQPQLAKRRRRRDLGRFPDSPSFCNRSD